MYIVISNNNNFRKAFFYFFQAPLPAEAPPNLRDTGNCHC